MLLRRCSPLPTAIALSFLLPLPLRSQSWQFTKVLDQATQRPDGRGVFAIHLVQSTPAFDGTWVAFRDPGLLNDGGDKAAIWSYHVPGGRFVKLADWNTPVPGAGATFRDFQFADTAPVLRDGRVVFAARDSAARPGIYSLPAAGGALQSVADTVSANPSGGFFTVFDPGGRQMGGFSFDGSTVAFKASGSQLTAGLYSAQYDGSSLRLIADGAHPASDGMVTDFSSPAVSGANVVLVGRDATPDNAGFSAVYLAAPGGGGALTELVSSATPLPGNDNPNFHTRIDLPVLALDGNLAVFHATDTNSASRGLSGLFGYDLSSRTLFPIAGSNTTAPGGTLRAAGFGGVAVHLGAVLFLGYDSSGGSALYLWRDNTLTRVIGTGDTLDGRTVQALTDPGPSALNGTSFAFIADFGRDRGLFVASPSASSPGLAASIPHLASGDGWSSTITLVNTARTPGQARLDFFDDAGSPLTLPLEFSQTPSMSGDSSTMLQRLLAAGQSLVVASQAPDRLLSGSAQVLAAAGIGGVLIFRDSLTGQEAAVPWETRAPALLTLPFDNTGGLATGVAVANGSAAPAAVPIVLRGSDGATLASSSLQLPARGHAAFDLASSYPGTSGRMGTVTLSTPAGGRISALGLRFSPAPSGSRALTSIPVLTAAAGGVGTLAQIACGAGWQTSFLLVNTGSAPAAAELQFFDNQGSPLPLPLSYPQSGRAATAASAAETLAPGASLLIVAGEAPSLLVGSARLTAAEGLTGFAIFRYNPSGQEAAVPLEVRDAASYVLPFDNTAGVGTGVAVANVSGQPASIGVVLRDDSGSALASGTLSLPPLGHDSFELDRLYAASTGRRGTIEFATPAGGRISVLGLRTAPLPSSNGFAVTTLPVLAR